MKNWLHCFLCVSLLGQSLRNKDQKLCQHIAHPQSHYFGLGKIGRDQLEDYAARKGMSIEEAEKWLRPVLE
jgi:hypothetical protein